MNHQIILPAGSTSIDLQAAINQLQDGDEAVITICSDMPFTQTVMVNFLSGVDIAIKSDQDNNYRLFYDLPLSGSLFSCSHASLSFSNITLDGGGESGGIVATNSNIFINQGATILNCSSGYVGGAILGENGTKVVISSGATIKDCNAQSGGGVYVSNGEFAMYDGAVIKNCEVQNNGGGVMVSTSIVNIYGGTISNNQSLFGIGGGAYIDGTSGYGAIIHDGTITKNTAANGGGLFLSNVVLRGGTISQNEGYQVGGGISSILLLIEGGTISGNKSPYCGGLYISGNTHVKDAVFEANIADEGGAIGVFSEATITNCKIINNKATSGNGGGILNNGWLSLISDTLISGNMASANGGGMAHMSSFECPMILGSQITANKAGASGGGIYWHSMTPSSLATDENTVFSCNCADAGYVPPADASTLYPNIKFASTSIENHVINNFDISYQGEQPIDIDFELMYSANGGMGSYEVTGILPGETVTVLTLEQTGITNPNYLFVEWNTQPDASGISYAPNDALTVCCSTVLYAIWGEPQEYLVSYDANGGTGSRVEQHQYGEYYVILSPADAKISRQGYAFLGWNTQNDGGGTMYFAGEIVFAESGLSLYAQWRQISTIKGLSLKGCRAVIEGQKIWADDDNAQDTRPPFVQILLFRNGTEYRRKELSSLGDGRFWFYCVPAYDNSGNKYIYTIDEVQPDNYSKAIQGYTIINTLIP